MRYRRIALALNSVLLLVSILALYDASSEITDRSPGFRVYMLIRRGVISLDEEKAREMNPQFSNASVHTNIGRWIAARQFQAETILGMLGLLIATANLVVVAKNKPVSTG
jgi:hypothetical protein